MVYSSDLIVAFLDLENTELKRAKIYHLPNKIPTQYAMVGKKREEWRTVYELWFIVILTFQWEDIMRFSTLEVWNVLWLGPDSFAWEELLCSLFLKS